MKKQQTIKLTCDPRYTQLFLRWAERFQADYPERSGLNNGCVYSADLSDGSEVSAYVYKTKSGMIVARQNH